MPKYRYSVTQCDHRFYSEMSARIGAFALSQADDEERFVYKDDNDVPLWSTHHPENKIRIHWDHRTYPGRYHQRVHSIAVDRLTGYFHLFTRKVAPVNAFIKRNPHLPVIVKERLASFDELALEQRHQIEPDYPIPISINPRKRKRLGPKRKDSLKNKVVSKI